MSSPFLLAQGTSEAAPKATETAGGEAAVPEKPAETATTEETTGQGETGSKSEQPSKNDEKQPGGFFGGSIWLPLVMIVVLMYFILFRPQRKQEKKRREMLSAMAKNSRVVTIGGIHGIIYSVGDTDVVLKIDERNDVRIRVAKSHIGRVLTDEDEAGQGSTQS